MAEQTAIFKANLKVYVSIISNYLVSEHGWVLKSVEDCVNKLSFTIPNKLVTKEYRDSGKYPIISQGKSFIEAYTDDRSCLIKEDLPLIIFGDHTKQLKYVNFPFVLGADGVKLLKPSAHYFPRLFYYLLHNIELPEKSYSRHYKYLCNSKIAFPAGNNDMNLQKYICDFLDFLSEGDVLNKLFFAGRIEEQITNIQRITSNINDLSFQVDTQSKYIAFLRHAVLQEAIEGKLTVEWRKQNPKLISGDNHASKLLEKIKTEKERLIKEGKIKKDSSRAQSRGKPLPPITDPEKPFDLPEGWVWCRLGEVSDLITKGSSPNWQGIRYVDRGAGVRFITSKNVGIYNVDLTDETFVEAGFNEIEPRSILEKGDILTNIVGASIGRTAVYELDEIANINQAVCLIRISSKLIDKQYVLHWMNSPFLIAKMHEDEFAPGRANLSMGNVAGFLLAIPPSAEQSKIIDRLDQLMIVVDELEKQVSECKDQAEMLMQSVLREAFTGEETNYG